MKIDKGRIENFIRTRVEKDALTDAEMARLLNVSASVVSRWRNEFEIKPADKFYRKFAKKYDNAGGLEQFRSMIQKKFTFEEIARHFGFSREYARQVYLKLYGKARPVDEKTEARERAWHASQKSG